MLLFTKRCCVEKSDNLALLGRGLGGALSVNSVRVTSGQQIRLMLSVSCNSKASFMLGAIFNAADRHRIDPPQPASEVFQ
jgi:hypothetical protein